MGTVKGVADCMGGEETEFPEWPALEGWQRWTRAGPVCVWFFKLGVGGSGMCVNQEEEAGAGALEVPESRGCCSMESGGEEVTAPLPWRSQRARTESSQCFCGEEEH